MNSETRVTGFKITMKCDVDRGLTDQAKANREIILSAYSTMTNADIGALAQYFDDDIFRLRCLTGATNGCGRHRSKKATADDTE